MDDDFQYLFKIIIIGGSSSSDEDSSVGKTNLLTRFVRNEFNIQSKPTIGVDFFSKTVEIKTKKVKVQVWDTAGQERYKAFSSAYYNGANGAIITYDVTNRESFDNVKNWIQELKNHLNIEDTVVMMIGNKTDLDELRQVQTQEAGDFAKKHGMFFMETSALMNNSNEVPRAFMTVIEGRPSLNQEIMEKNPDQESAVDQSGVSGKQKSVKIRTDDEKRKKAKSSGNSCCN